jgi:hypothetical protein
MNKWRLFDRLNDLLDEVLQVVVLAGRGFADCYAGSTSSTLAAFRSGDQIILGYVQTGTTGRAG